MTDESAICPRCKLPALNPTPVANSLSRKDNETIICNACGTDEAMLDAGYGNYAMRVMDKEFADSLNLDAP